MLKVALVGLGDIAQKAYLPVITMMRDRVELLLCTRNANTLAQLQLQYGIESGFVDYQDVLAAKPDAVMIHSATESHFPLAKQALEAGIAVFVDKPLADNLAECEALVQLAKQKQQVLFVGFNRRFTPLHTQMLNKAQQQKALKVHYQKNRVNLADAAKTFIFDDFIHVLDSVRYLGSQGSDMATQALHIFSHFNDDGELAIIEVNWQAEGILHTATMNRLNGLVDERLECFYNNEKWQVDGLVQGEHWIQGQLQPLKGNDWQATLTKRGFAAMIDCFLNQLVAGHCPDGQYDDILQTHILADKVYKAVSS